MRKLIYVPVVAGILIAALTACEPTTEDVAAKHSTPTVSQVAGASSEAEATPTPSKKAKPKPHYTVSQQQAIKAAKSYVESGHFSKAGLIHQLTSQYGEGFPKKDVLFALAHVKVDWNAEAYQAAKSYLDSGHFSHAGLLHQLTSAYGEGFTQAQAAQALKRVGL